MSALANFLRARERADVARLTPIERIHLALSLGDADVEIFCAAGGDSPERARRRIAASRHAGRRASLVTTEQDK
jgi:hypothetical protein